MYYEDAWLGITFDPSSEPYYLNEYTPYPIKTLAFQTNPDDNDVPVAIWLKTGMGELEWSKIWPGVSIEEIINNLTTNETFITNITNVTNVSAPTPTQVATTLFPALKPDPNRGEVACVFTGGRTKGSEAQMLAGWTQISTGVLEYQFAGPLQKSWLDGVDPDVSTPGKASSLIGKTILAYYLGDTSGSGEEALQGPWVFDSVGLEWQKLSGGGYRSVSTYPRIHRAPGYNVGKSLQAGVAFQVQTGDTWGTKFFTLASAAVVGTDPLVLTVTDTKAWSDKHELCTGPELTTEGVSLAAQTVVGTLGGSAASDTTVAIGNPFVAASALGITSIPAEPFEIDIAAIDLAGANYDSLVSVGCQLWEVTPDGGSEVGAMIASGECVPLSNGTTTSIVFKATPSAPRSVSPTDKLLLLWTLHLKATSLQATLQVTIHYGAPWGTFITVPWQMAISGASTGRHKDLSGRNDEFQHPECAIYSVSESVATAGGWLTPGVASNGDRVNHLRYSMPAQDFFGIAKHWSDGTAIPDLFVMTIRIGNATPGDMKRVNSGATPPTGSDFLPLANDALPNGTGKMHSFNGPTTMQYQLNLTDGRWELLAFQTYAMVT